jgi:NADPH:quinone reductase-like Zn-dependent oxidoreductase
LETDNFHLHRHPEVFGAVNTIEGFDVVGVVEQVGLETPGFSAGDKVVTFTRGIGPRKF